MSEAERAPAGSGTRAAVARATWNGVLLAGTARPVLLEGHVYFPPGDVRREHRAATRHRSLCAWQGLARCCTVRAGGQQNPDAAWYYPHPGPLARKIKNQVAFWQGVRVDAGPASPAQAAGQARARAVPEARCATAMTPGTQGRTLSA